MANRLLSARCVVTAVLLVTVLLASSAAAQEGPLTVMICYPGGPGSADEAAPRLSRFFRLVEQKAGWKEGRVTAQYLTRADACARFMAEKKPHAAILSLGGFLAAGATLKAEPVLEVLPPGGGEQRYHVVVQHDAAVDLAGLQGKRLAGDTLGDVAFLTRVVFAGAVDAATHFVLESTPTALSGIKKVNRKTADAVLLDTHTFEQLKTLPFGAAMRAVFTSDAVPGWPVIALGDAKAGDRLVGADRDAFVAALTAACGDEAGRAICEEVMLGGFRPAKPGAYDAVRARYDGGTP